MTLSFDSIKKLMKLDPADYDFVIPDVNKALCNLVLLSSTPQRPIPEQEQVNHAINAYKRIKQPEMWAHWVREQMNDYLRNRITSIQPFLKYNQIKSEQDGQFNAASTTIQEDIVAMFAAKTAKKGTKRKSDVKAEQEAQPEPKKPPFLRHFKHSTAPDAPLYQVGDSKEWDGVTYYFCDAPTHRDKVRWHRHPPDNCNVRKRYLAKKNANEPNAEANVVDDTPDDATQATQVSSAAAQDSDIASLLASALVLAPDDNVRNVLNDAISVITDM